MSITSQTSSDSIQPHQFWHHQTMFLTISMVTVFTNHWPFYPSRYLFHCASDFDIMHISFTYVYLLFFPDFCISVSPNSTSLLGMLPGWRKLLGSLQSCLSLVVELHVHHWSFVALNTNPCYCDHCVLVNTLPALSLSINNSPLYLLLIRLHRLMCLQPAHLYVSIYNVTNIMSSFFSEVLVSKPGIQFLHSMCRQLLDFCRGLMIWQVHWIITWNTRFTACDWRSLQPCDLLTLFTFFFDRYICRDLNLQWLLGIWLFLPQGRQRRLHPQWWFFGSLGCPPKLSTTFHICAAFT